MDPNQLDKKLPVIGLVVFAVVIPFVAYLGPLDWASPGLSFALSGACLFGALVVYVQNK